MSSLVGRYVRRRRNRKASRQEEAANPVAGETGAVSPDLTIAARGMVRSVMETVGLTSVDDFLAEAVSSGFTPEGDIWVTSDVVRARDRIREARAEAAAPRVVETTGPNWRGRFAGVIGWVIDFGRKLVSREGLTLVTSLFALVAAAYASVAFANGNLQGALIAVIVAIASGIIALYLSAPLVGIDLSAYVSRIARWRPNWQRPSWLKRPQIKFPQIQRPQIQRPGWLRMPNISRPQVQLSWPSRVPRPSRREMSLMCLAVALIAVGALVISLWPETAAVVEEPVVAEPTVVVSVPVIPTVAPEPTTTVEPTAEPTTVPVAPEKVVVVGRVKETADKAVSGATVSVGESDDRTDDEGIFRVPDVSKAEEYALDIVMEDTVRRIVREGGGYLSGPSTDDVGEFLLSDAMGVEAETAVETVAQTETETKTKTKTKTEAHIVTVESGDTLWDLLEEELSQAPTWEQIKSVVDANDLVDKGVNDAGLWIVLIQIGQTIDLGPALSG